MAWNDKKSNKHLLDFLSFQQEWSRAVRCIRPIRQKVTTNYQIADRCDKMLFPKHPLDFLENHIAGPVLRDDVHPVLCNKISYAAHLTTHSFKNRQSVS